jgi:hypothetical protein
MKLRRYRFKRQCGGMETEMEKEAEAEVEVEAGI